MVVKVAPHSWSVTPEQAERIQRWMAERASIRSPEGPLRLVAGVDVAYGGDMACAAVVVWDSQSRAAVEQLTVVRRVEFPYIPGLLAFREIPPIIKALEELQSDPDVLLCDGHGLAHPRRFGLASHLGVMMGLSCVGCAKKILHGTYEEPEPARGSSSPIMDRGDMIGRAVRTREGSQPLFVSPGHRMEALSSEELVMACCRDNRLPEPLRLAHLLSKEDLP